MTVASTQRFTRQRPCAICGGYDQAERGNGERCFGYGSANGEYANCTREEHAGGLPQHDDDTYGHRLTGACGCGKRHDPSPASSNGTSRKIVATYDYHDEGGNFLFQAVRYQPKGFSQRRPDGRGGWINDLKGVRRVLYRLPELTEADPSEPVFLVEGEKDVDRLRGIGLVATCNPMGAKKWLKAYSEQLQERYVVILPDNDQDGRDHVVKVVRSLQGKAESTRVLQLPGLLEKGDVSDWLDSGGTTEELLDLASQAQEGEPPANLSGSEPQDKLVTGAKGKKPKQPAWSSWLPREVMAPNCGTLRTMKPTPPY